MRMITKSDRFINERALFWEESRDLVKHIERKGLHTLSEEKITKIPVIYRKLCSEKYIYYQTNSVLNLFYINKKYECKITIKIIPDILQIKKYDFLVRKNLTNLIGIKKSKWSGIGTEIAYLREYNVDDDSKYIDWKASTRTDKLLTKVFQKELL